MFTVNRVQNILELARNLLTTLENFDMNDAYNGYERHRITGFIIALLEILEFYNEFKYLRRGHLDMLNIIVMYPDTNKGRTKLRWNF